MVKTEMSARSNSKRPAARARRERRGNCGLKDSVHDWRIQVLLIMVLVIAVRLYFYTGPVFGNTFDELFYLNIISSCAQNGVCPNFSMYQNANFSDYSMGIFNPAVMFSFYGGLIYPEIFLNEIAGFSVEGSIFYVIAMSAVEAAFLYLIIREISNERAALIGAAIFAFFPLNIIFSDQVQPFVPAMAMLTAGVYFWLRSDIGLAGTVRRHVHSATVFRGKHNRLYLLLTGFFIGLGYITNPIVSSMMIFLVLLYAYRLIARKFSFAKDGMGLSLIILGFLLAFSITGIYYLATSGNFFLYPDVERASVINIATTSGIYPTYIRLFGNVLLEFDSGSPITYIGMLFNVFSGQKVEYAYFNLISFSILGYLLPVFIAVLAFAKKFRYRSFFVAMLLFDLLVLFFFPDGWISLGGSFRLLMISDRLMYATLLVLPVTVISALGIERILESGKKYAKIAGAAALVAIVIVSLYQQSYDSSFYRSSVYSLNMFDRFAAMHPNATYYTSTYFANEANLLTDYRYNITALYNCSSANIASIESGRNAYLVVGGSLGLSLSPTYTTSFESCVLDNMTSGYRVVFTAKDPYAPYERLMVIKQ
ncbi:MAG: glycosyltransferase family 39 protein [Candidatus Micrarchaeales archaeon]|jgi:hypothetical protein|nr:glycosyltransferase family 39 protein [Candidatus Micrarchaeales archaeon]